MRIEGEADGHGDQPEHVYRPAPDAVGNHAVEAQQHDEQQFLQRAQQAREFGLLGVVDAHDLEQPGLQDGQGTRVAG